MQSILQWMQFLPFLVHRNRKYKQFKLLKFSRKVYKHIFNRDATKVERQGQQTSSSFDLRTIYVTYIRPKMEYNSHL